MKQVLFIVLCLTLGQSLYAQMENKQLRKELKEIRNLIQERKQP